MGGQGRGWTVGAVTAAAAVAALADHGPLGAVDPTDQEQLAIYALNRARNDPTAYGNEIGFDLSEVAAQPPLAVNRNLTGSARFHAAEMFDHHYYAHTSAVTGFGANQMAVQNGYDAFGNGLGANWGVTNSIESIARGVNTLPSSLNALSAWIIDKDVVGAGHRVHLMAMHPQFQAHREIGFGVATGTDSFPEFNLPKLLPTRLYAVHTANRGGTTQYLTGVVFRDRNGNLRYDAGEGIAGANIESSPGSATTSMASGGWTLPASPGFTVVTCEFEGWFASAPVTVGSSNMEIDFTFGVPAGAVSFGFRNGIPGTPGVYANQLVVAGTAPVSTSISAVGDFDHVEWVLEGASRESGSTVEPSHPSGGLFPYLMTATSPSAWSSDVAIVAVDDPAGAGEGTTLPASRALGAPKGSLKRNLKLAGKDQAKLACSLELPGGFSPAGKTVQVCIGGVKGTFTLDAKGKGKDLETGSTIALKGKFPAVAGAVAKVAVTVKGSLGDALEATGVENRTAAGVVRTVPLGVWVSGVYYFAYGQSTATTVYGKSGKAAIVILPPE
jgi:hypothetical protein